MTVLLERLRGGEPEAANELFGLCYGELRGLAGAIFRSQKKGHSLAPTVLVHEAYLKLVDQQRAEWKDRSHFFAVAALAMRQILVNYARRAKAARRGGSATPVSLEEGIVMQEGAAEEILALNESLDRLAERNSRQAKIVELRFFVGLTTEETATALGISPATVKRDWALASAWLKKEIQEVAR